MTCIVREYKELHQRPDYNGRHRMMINSLGNRFIVYHHEYNFYGNRYGRCWIIIQLDENYNLMQEQGHIRCYDDSLEKIIEHFPELWEKRFALIDNSDNAFVMYRSSEPKDVMGYFVKGKEVYIISKRQLPDKRRKIKSRANPTPSCKLEPPDQNIFEKSYSYTNETDSYVTAEAYSDIDHRMWLHVHECCKKLL